MLVQFCFKNFKSFRDDTILDMSATKITEHSDRIISAGNEKLLSVAAIYGANASGKSNVIEAFRFMVTYVLESFSYGGDHDTNRYTENRNKNFAANIKKCVSDGFFTCVNDTDFALSATGQDAASGILNRCAEKKLTPKRKRVDKRLQRCHINS